MGHVHLGIKECFDHYQAFGLIYSFSNSTHKNSIVKYINNVCWAVNRDQENVLASKYKGFRASERTWRFLQNLVPVYASRMRAHCSICITPCYDPHTGAVCLAVCGHHFNAPSGHLLLFVLCFTRLVVFCMVCQL